MSQATRSADVFFDPILELIRRTSAVLPADVGKTLLTHTYHEAEGSPAKMAMRLIMQNIAQADRCSAPICQDTGTINFYIGTPVGFNQLALEKVIHEAVRAATAKGYLRQNSVDIVTGRNSGDNLGPGSPVIHWHQHEADHLDVRLILKGGGCENMSAQYSLPTTLSNGVRADRDIDGVRMCILDAIHQAQGKGCGPGFIGVCIGGDRASGYAHAKEQLLRGLEDSHPDSVLAKLEADIIDQANELKIGPMGFGGRLTLAACKVSALNRLPASYFVSIAYMCWAYRRRGFILDTAGQIVEWHYQIYREFDSPDDIDDGLLTMEPLDDPPGPIELNTPLTEEVVRGLKAGDFVSLSGTLYTGRDAVHKYLHSGGDVPVLRGAVLYHCGPVVLEKDGQYQVIAAGPTTSIREEPYQAEVIERYGIKAVIGKGGMGQKTLEACQKFGCVYLHAIGGAAQIYAGCVKEVPRVFLKEEFGSPEAVWELRVENFPAVVTMDAHGRSWHQEIAAKSGRVLERLTLVD